MKITIKETRNTGVTFASTRWIVDLKKGLWWVDLLEFERYLNEKLEKRSFGESVETFYFGFEIWNLTDEWKATAKVTSDYISYRPSMKALVSVGQLDWNLVKHLEPAAQLEHLSRALETAIARTATMKRKPRSFDYNALLHAVRKHLAELPIEQVLAEQRSSE